MDPHKYLAFGIDPQKRSILCPFFFFLMIENTLIMSKLTNEERATTINVSSMIRPSTRRILERNVKKSRGRVSEVDSFFFLLLWPCRPLEPRALYYHRVVPRYVLGAVLFSCWNTAKNCVFSINKYTQTEEVDSVFFYFGAFWCFILCCGW